MSSEPGVIVHAHHGAPRRASRARRASSSMTRGAIGDRRSTLHVHGDGAEDDDGFDLDRASYMSTALAALPGMSLRKFFVPVMRLYKQRLAERRATRERFADGQPIDMASKSMEKKVQDGMTTLAKALMDASREVGVSDGSTLSVDPKILAELLHGKVDPVSISANHVLTYPSEAPESQFVYILLSGSVNVTYYQPQNRRVSGYPITNAATGAADTRTQFFTSSDEKIMLCGGGMNIDGSNLFLAAAQAHEARQNNNNNAVNETGSNMTSAIQRSLRNASRAVGQPTLIASRSEMLRAPMVIGAVEALGMTPSKCATLSAATTSHGKGEITQYVPYVDALRIRLLDVHEAVLQLCACRGSIAGGVGVRPAEAAENGLVVAAARAKTLSTYYYENEVLMRQSWLLQDTPTAALRTLISLLRPRTYLPGEVVACPHRHTPLDRQLCFIRRGRLLISEPPASTSSWHTRRSVSPAGGGGGGYDGSRALGTTSTHRRHTNVGGTAGCACVAGVEASGTSGLSCVGMAEAGASFGELSLLFGEPRSLTLVADTACDVWCLSYADFAVCMRRDEALRRSLIDKAAALRMRWLGEQRFTVTLAQQLRESCELFRPLSDYVIRLIQERLEPIVYSPGAIVASTSERCDGLIMIVHGRVVSIIDGVSSYGPGDVIGEGCLVAHRWPLGLSARTMVEGWKLKREGLQSALEKADLLHAHSGETTSMTPLWLKRIFAPPLPEVETDVIGRQRMPSVGAAPGGESYPRYGRVMSEVFLKALCFRYRDYVRWEDICYDTLGDPQNFVHSQRTDQLSREVVMAQLQGTLATAKGEARPATAPLAARLGAPTPPLAGTAKAVSGRRGGGARATRGGAQDQEAPGSGRRRVTLQDVHAAAAATAAAAAATQTSADTNDTKASPHRYHAAGAGLDAAKKARQSSTRAASGQPTSSGKRARAGRAQKKTAGASAFLVNDNVIPEPFRPRQGVLMSVARGSAPAAPSARRPSTASTAPGTAEAAVPEGLLTPAAASRWDRMVAYMQQPPPQLDALSAVLDERDRLYSTERQQDLTTEQQQAQREAQVRERLQALKASSAAAAAKKSAAQHGPRSATTTPTASSAPPFAIARVSSAGGQIAPADTSPIPPPLPPVHLFLSDPENPRAELTVAEAIAIGYVLQLPDKDHIQSSVSVVDPDVTLGLPSHRARRHSMALTPNDRHHRHNFLFAGANFLDATESVSRYQERKGMDQERQTKARRLMDMLQAGDAHRPPRHHHRRGQKKNKLGDPAGEATTGDVSSLDPFGHDGSGEEEEAGGAYDEPSAVAPTGTDAYHGAHRQNEYTAADRATSPTTLSPQVSAGFFVSPERDHASEGSTPSPFRGSPGKATQKREEGYMRLLGREPLRAMDLLYHKYHMPWKTASASSVASPTMYSSTHSRGLAQAPPALAATGKSASLTERLIAATQPTTEPMPGLNFDEPELVFASGRDRKACAAFLSVGGRGGGLAAMEGLSGGSAAFGGSHAIPTPPRTPSQRTAGMRLATPTTAATSTTTVTDTATCAIDAAVHAPEAVLFVDGYGTLKPEPAPVRNHALLCLPLDPMLLPPSPRRAFGSTSGGSPAATRYSFAAAGGAAGASSPGASFFSHEAPRPQDLVMPDPEEAGQFMRRMQRDVVGLNAIAEEQARKREQQRTLEPRLARREERVEAALATPTADEEQVVQDWHRSYHIQTRDPLAVVRVPDALLPQAGPNYLAREMERLQRYVAQGSSTAHANVVAWQDQIVGPSATLYDERQQGGVGSSRRPSGQSARRVVASIGTKQLGYPSAPLVSPTQALGKEDYEQWISQREQFFASYAQQQQQNPDSFMTSASVAAGTVPEPFMPVS